jgi:hypothetical protein
MAFGKNEAVAIRPMRIGRIVIHHIVKERNNDLHCGERTAGVPGLSRAGHFDNPAPGLLADGL